MIKKIGLVIAILFLVENVHAQNASIKDSLKNITDTIEAFYPNGFEGFRKFLQKTLNANAPSENNSPLGIYTTITSFNVNTSGVLTDIKAETNVGFGAEAEAIRVIKKSGNWIPASSKGKTIKSTYKQPITFAVEEDGIDFKSNNGYYTLIAGETNQISIKIRKTKNSSFIVSVSEGSIINNEDGNYNLQPEKVGRLLISVHNKKNNKLICSAYFNVIKKK